jgi:PKD repeat protein
MKPIYSLLALLLCASLSAQNTYHTIIELNAGEGWLRSSAAADVTLATRLLIYQYGGATINNSGAVSSLNGAGHYDLNRVSRMGGDTIFLALPVRHNYNLAATQLVTFEAALTVGISGQDVATPAFDGRTGGIRLLVADDTLRLGADTDIRASGLGFRGGSGTEADSDCSRLTNANGETYAAGNWRGSSRGEGVAGVPAGQEFGRAPAANGGGGGNDHNAGGGGGGNIAAGGIGARNIVMGLFNNACRGNNPGRGGRGLTTNGERVYFGGGGGAGHANNTSVANGGKGGGLIVLWAPNIIFAAGARLLVDGAAAPGPISGDGGGGGGAAGAVLVVAGAVSGHPEIAARGGKGSDVTNQSDRCFGPGGGGGGGQLVVKADNRSDYDPSVNNNSGGAGQRLNSNECAPTDEPGGSGERGSEQNLALNQPFGGFRQDVDTLCGAGTIRLADASFGAQQVSWELTPANDALTVNATGPSLDVTSDGTVDGTFRAVQTLIYNGVLYPGDTALLTFFPAPSVVAEEVVTDDEFLLVTLSGAINFDAIRYDFGDGTVIDTNLTAFDYTYAAGGDYPLTITLRNARCGNIVVASQTISVPTFAAANIDAKNVEGCVPLQLVFSDISTGVYNARRWAFPGASPEASTEQRPTIIYAEPGTYTAFLFLEGAVGRDTVDSIAVTVYAIPVADFAFSVDTSTAAFTNLSLEGTNYEWTFGDDRTSTTTDPVHVFDTRGTFAVTLIARNGPCRDTIVQQVTVAVLSDVTELAALGVKVFPNPTSGLLKVSGPAQITGVYELGGRLIARYDGQVADLGGLPGGTYIVGLLAAGQRYSVLVMVR